MGKTMGTHRLRTESLYGKCTRDSQATTSSSSQSNRLKHTLSLFVHHAPKYVSSKCIYTYTQYGLFTNIVINLLLLMIIIILLLISRLIYQLFRLAESYIDYPIGPRPGSPIVDSLLSLTVGSQSDQSATSCLRLSALAQSNNRLLPQEGHIPNKLENRGVFGEHEDPSFNLLGVSPRLYAKNKSNCYCLPQVVAVVRSSTWQISTNSSRLELYIVELFEFNAGEFTQQNESFEFSYVGSTWKTTFWSST